MIKILRRGNEKEHHLYRLDKCDETFLVSARGRFFHRVSTSLSPEIVFDVVSNLLELEHEWFPGSVHMRWKTPPPHGVGSVREHRLTYMTVIEDFLVWERGRRLVLRLTHCSLPLLSAYLEDYRMERRDDGGTDLIWEICYRSRPVLAILHPILRPAFARDFRNAARGLEKIFTRLTANP